MTVIDTPQGTTYTPWTDGYAVGYRVEHADGSTEFIYLNPSGDSDGGAPNVFVYIGIHGDPAHDPPAHFYDLGSPGSGSMHRPQEANDG